MDNNYDYADDEEIQPTKHSANDKGYDLLKNLEFSIDAKNSSIKLKQDEIKSIKAMMVLKLKESDQSAKSGVDLICVIDCSGSMSGDKMEMVKKTLKLLLDFLTEKDRLCLVQFTTSAQRLTPLLRASPQNRIKFEQAIDSMRAGGGDIISVGTHIAFEQIKKRKYRNNVTSIFLLSDGQDTSAEVQVKKQLKQFDEPFTIHSFGYGQDHDAKLMTSICSLKNGGFYFVLDYSFLGEYFVNALGGLVSVVGENTEMQVKLVAQAPFTGIRITNTYGNMWEKLNDFNYKIKIPQISKGNNKSFIFELTIPKYDAQMGKLPKVVQVIDATLELKSIYTNEIVKKQSTLNLTFVEKEEQIPQANEKRQQSVEEQINRVTATDTIEKAITDCEQHQFEQAQAKLDHTINDINTNQNLTKVSKGIIQDLNQAKKAAQPGKYQESGRNHLHQMVSNFQNQVGINAYFDENGTQIHKGATINQNNEQRLMVQKVNAEIYESLKEDIIENEEEPTEEPIDQPPDESPEDLSKNQKIQEGLFKDLLLAGIVAFCCCIFGIVQLFFGIIYPLKTTFNSYFQKEKQSLWINYWIIMSLFYIIESITFDVLFMIPFYQEIKTVFAVWLYYEKFQGALLIGEMAQPIYKQFTPFLAGFQDKINMIEQEKQEKQEQQEKEKTQ